MIAGGWRPATARSSFHAENPATGQTLAESYPVSDWADVNAALNAAVAAFAVMQTLPAERLAEFLKAYAAGIKAGADEICAAAAAETGYPVSPRLKDVELPRTVNQLR